MEELNDKQYGEIRNGVEKTVDKKLSDSYFINYIAYLTPNAIILKDGKYIRVKDRTDMIKTIIGLITEEAYF